MSLADFPSRALFATIPVLTVLSACFSSSETAMMALNGLILETLETIPEANLCLQVDEFRIETLQIGDNAVKHCRVAPASAAA